MTGTSEESWINEALTEADEMTKKDLEANVNVSNVIASGEKSASVITVNGVEIRHQSFIPRPLRRRLVKLSAQTKDTDYESVEGVMYKTLATICIDPPFNSPQTWSYIEEKGGDAASVLAMIMANINKSQEELKTFRGKQ